MLKRFLSVLSVLFVLFVLFFLTPPKSPIYAACSFDSYGNCGGTCSCAECGTCFCAQIWSYCLPAYANCYSKYCDRWHQEHCAYGCEPTCDGGKCKPPPPTDTPAPAPTKTPTPTLQTQASPTPDPNRATPTPGGAECKDKPPNYCDQKYCYKNGVHIPNCTSVCINGHCYTTNTTPTPSVDIPCNPNGWGSWTTCTCNQSAYAGCSQTNSVAMRYCVNHPNSNHKDKLLYS